MVRSRFTRAKGVSQIRIRNEFRESGSLTIETVVDEDTYTVRVAGELDLANCARFDREVRDAEASNAPTILLDIDGLVFVDSAGLAMIRRAEARSRSGGNRLRLTRGRGHVADLFRLTALDQTLPFTGSR